MAPTKKKYRRTPAQEQEILADFCVRRIRPDEVARFDQLIAQHHYLQSAQLVGEHMRYVAEFEGPWLALGAWHAAVRHLRGRDAWIGWSDEQRRRRLPLVANNARLLTLPGQRKSPIC